MIFLKLNSDRIFVTNDRLWIIKELSRLQVRVIACKFEMNLFALFKVVHVILIYEVELFYEIYICLRGKISFVKIVNF